jgi:hypothetical protein
MKSKKKIVILTEGQVNSLMGKLKIDNKEKAAVTITTALFLILLSSKNYCFLITN